MCVSLTVRDAEMRMPLYILYSSLFVLFFLFAMQCRRIMCIIVCFDIPLAGKNIALFFDKLKPLFLLDYDSCYSQSFPKEGPSFHFDTKTTMKSCLIAEPQFQQISPNEKVIARNHDVSDSKLKTRNVVIARPDLYVSVGITILCQKVLTNLSNSGHCGGQPKEG